jgi:hypothetical protein
MAYSTRPGWLELFHYLVFLCALIQMNGAIKIVSSVGGMNPSNMVLCLRRKRDLGKVYPRP